MNQTYSASATLSRVGTHVVTLSELPGIPVGTNGRVVRVHRSDGRGGKLGVRWELPRKRTTVFAQVGEFSFNIPWWTKPPITEFNISEAGQLLSPIHSR
ncbi:hypothetical protein GC207_00120 [bacterium]|nr:hypothetical protein [bacterium]